MVISITVPIASFMKSAQKSDGGLSDVKKLLRGPIVILWPWGGDSPGATRAVVGPVNSATGHRLLSNLSWKMCVVRRLLNIYVLNTARVVLS